MQPLAKVKENVGVSNSTIAGMVVLDMLDPNRSDNVAIIFNSSFAGVQFFNPSPIVHSTAEILSPLIPTIVASSDYEKVVDTHSDSVTHTLRSCMDFDLGLDSSGGPLLADTCSHLANTGPHGVINEVDFTLKSAPKPQSVVCGLAKPDSTHCKVVQATSSRWKPLARKAKQPSLALRVEPKRGQPEVGHSSEAPDSKRLCLSFKSQF
ncbi:hypothetical protein ACOSP7_004197 [Xanthoceras sorbifolium]